MALIMESGTNLDTALEESAKVFNNKYLNSLIIETKNDVIEGKDFIHNGQKVASFFKYLRLLPGKHIIQIKVNSF